MMNDLQAILTKYFATSLFNFNERINVVTLAPYQFYFTILERSPVLVKYNLKIYQGKDEISLDDFIDILLRMNKTQQEQLLTALAFYNLKTEAQENMVVGEKSIRKALSSLIDNILNLLELGGNQNNTNST